MDYEKMTCEELIALNQKLGAEREAIQEERREIAKVLDVKLANKEVLIKLGQMSDAQKHALTQLLTGAGGIVSEEKIGTPG